MISLGSSAPGFWNEPGTRPGDGGPHGDHAISRQCAGKRCGKLFIAKVSAETRFGGPAQLRSRSKVPPQPMCTACIGVVGLTCWVAIHVLFMVHGKPILKHHV